MGDEAPDAPLGRERELSTLAGYVAQAANGDGRAILIHGPAGIGKTTVLAAAMDAARQQGLTVLSARGSEVEQEVPFGIVRALLEEQAAADETLLDGVARHARGTLLDAGQESSGTDGVLRSLCWVVTRMAREHPVVLIVDDVQWADDASRRFLDMLRVRLSGVPVLLLAAARDGVAAGSGIEHWFADASVRSLGVPPLGTDVLSLLVRERLPDADDDACAACAVATGGNPFLLGALIDDLKARGETPVAAEIGAVTPDTVIRATGVRVEALGKDAGGLARAAAVLGGPLVPSRAARLAGLSTDEAAGAVQALVDDGLLTEVDGQLNFPHPLLLSAVRESAGPVERVRLSGAAGRLLAGEPGQVDQACAHLLVSDPSSDEEVVDTLMRGAASAMRRGDPRAARRLLGRALEEPPALEQLASVAVATLAATYVGGDPIVVEDGMRVLEVSDDPGDRLRAAISVGSVYTLVGRATEGVTLLRSHIIPEAPEELCAEARQLVAAWGSMDLEARKLVRDSVTSLLPAARTDDAPLELLAMATLESVIGQGPASDVITFATRAMGSGELLRRHGSHTPLTTGPVFALAFAGDHRLAEELAEQVLDVSREEGSLVGTYCAIGGRGVSRALRGEVSGAEADIREALELEARGHGFGLVSAWLLEALSRCLRMTSGPAAASATLELLPIVARSANSMGGIRWIAERARVALADGRPRDALADLALLDAFDAGWPADGTWTGRHVIRSRALAALGDTDGALTSAEDAVVAARAFGAAGPLADALRARAVVTGGPPGDADLAEALSVTRNAGLVIDEIEVLFDSGSRALAQGLATEAREILGGAVDMAEIRGATALATEIQRAAVRAGARPRRVSRNGVAALTPAERRVADGAAAGRTNRQVAEDLFLTEKTVENHLTNAYRKLGIASRVELRDALA